MKYYPALLKESVDKSLELLVQGKLKGPHISGEFELDKVIIYSCGLQRCLRQSVQDLTSCTEVLWAYRVKITFPPP